MFYILILILFQKVILRRVIETEFFFEVGGGLETQLNELQYDEKA